MKTIEQLEQEFAKAKAAAEKSAEGVDEKIVNFLSDVIHAAFLQYTIGMMQQRESNEHCGGILNGEYLVGENCNEHRSKETGSDQADLSLNEQIEILKKANAELSFKLEGLEISGDGSGEALPEVSQEERDSDGWIDWDGGECPVNVNEIVEYTLRESPSLIERSKALYLDWGRDLQNQDRAWDIIAYRIVK